MKVCMLGQLICSLPSFIFAVCLSMDGMNGRTYNTCFHVLTYNLSCTTPVFLVPFSTISPFSYLAHLSLLPSHGEVFVYIFLLHEQNEWMDVCRLR
jgi:hypothetical protein